MEKNISTCEEFAQPFTQVHYEIYTSQINIFQFRNATLPTKCRNVLVTLKKIDSGNMLLFQMPLHKEKEFHLYLITIKTLILLIIIKYTT